MLLEDFYTIGDSTHNNGEYITEIKINRHHPVYQGHFPKKPVTPGVLLMQFFKEEAERQVGSLLQLDKAYNIKFMAVVDPNVDEIFTMFSSLEEKDGVIHLRGTAKHNGCIALKINALYKQKI